MFRPSSNESLTVSEEELNAQQAEQRLVDAEGKIVIILEDKKRISGELLEIEEKIEEGKKTIQDNNKEIVSLNDTILEVKSSLRTEKQNLDEFLKQKEAETLEVEDLLSKKQKEKEDIISEISALSKKHELNKFNQGEEIRELISQKSGLGEEIDALIKKEEATQEDIDDLQKLRSTISDDIKAVKEEKIKADSELTVLKNKVEDQNLIIENTKVVIGQLDITKDGKIADIKVLDDKIEQKTSEYKEIESRAFSILQKQELVNQKEAFIKSQYERAGIKWEE